MAACFGTEENFLLPPKKTPRHQVSSSQEEARRAGGAALNLAGKEPLEIDGEDGRGAPGAAAEERR
jgi:hypothetical protein